MRCEDFVDGEAEAHAEAKDKDRPGSAEGETSGQEGSLHATHPRHPAARCAAVERGLVAHVAGVGSCGVGASELSVGVVAEGADGAAGQGKAGWWSGEGVGGRMHAAWEVGWMRSTPE